MLQAMNTGHEGSLTTIHANSPRDALSRLETLVLTAGVDLPLRAIREQISSAFDLLVQIARLVDGSRRDHAHHRGASAWSPTSSRCRTSSSRSRRTRRPRHARPRLLAPLACTGLKPHFLEKMAANGVVLPPTFFEAEDGRRAASFARRASRRRDCERSSRSRAGRARAGCSRCARGRSAGGRRRPSASAPSTRAGTRRSRLTVVTLAAAVDAADAAENGEPSPGCSVEQPRRAKSVVLAIDRSQSMKGSRSRTPSPRRARSSRRSRAPTGSRVVALRLDARPARPASRPRRRRRDRARALASTGEPGTALYDAVVLAAQTLAREPQPRPRDHRRSPTARDVSSKRDAREAVDAAARGAGIAVYPSGSRARSSPRRRSSELASATGGAYHGAASTATLARDLRRDRAASSAAPGSSTTSTAARPGDDARARRAGPGAGAAARLAVPAQLGRRPRRRLLPPLALRRRRRRSCSRLAVALLVLARDRRRSSLEPRSGAAARAGSTPHVGQDAQTQKRESQTRERSPSLAALVPARPSTRSAHTSTGERSQQLLERADLPLRAGRVPLRHARRRRSVSGSCSRSPAPRRSRSWSGFAVGAARAVRCSSAIKAQAPREGVRGRSCPTC